MYVLTCPSCRAARQSPFVRVTAVTRCPSCQHTWRISTSHFVKNNGHTEPTQPVAPEPTLKHDEPGPNDPMGGSSVTGLSGLTEIMQAEPTPPSIAATKPQPVHEAKLAPASTSPTRPTPAGSAAAMPAMSPKTRRTAILIIGVLALIVALGGLSVMILSAGSDDVEPGDDTVVQPEADPASLPQGPPPPPDDSGSEPGAL